ncbi:MAG TPA: histidinol-phosphate transaminase [Candidatus Acidoferrales bacterium]|nr:histidinol-phosphate transaminase [Candidatus Acidoferrales bacterium]
MRVTVREDLKHVTPCEHGGRIIEASEDVPSVVDYSANFNPYLHPGTKAAMAQVSDALYRYPDPAYRRFREAVSEYLGVSPSAVVPSNGSVELIRLCAWALLKRGDKVVIPAPTFCEYELASRLSDAEPLFVPAYDEQELKRDILNCLASEDVRMVFLCNPNNPTGKGLGRDAVLDIASECSKNQTFLLVDEVFIELADPAKSIASADLGGVLVLRSLTKSFSIPGIRASYGITNAEFARQLNSVRVPWNLNAVAEAVTIALLKDSRSYLDTSRAKIASQREWLLRELAKISGLRPLESEANFMMVDISGTSLSSGDFAQRMKRRGCLVRDCKTFRLTGANYVRIAVRTKAENMRLLQAVKQVVAEKA